MSDDLARVREIRSLADGASNELQTASRPSAESAGVAWVCVQAIADIAEEWERDLLSPALPSSQTHHPGAEAPQPGASAGEVQT